MYGLPEDFDGSFLIGRVLEVVSYSDNSLSLGFDNRVSITIESSFEYRSRPGGGDVELQRVPVRSSSVMQLLGHSVESVDSDRDGTLGLQFSGGSVFRCFDDQSAYECYRIANGDSETYV